MRINNICCLGGTHEGAVTSCAIAFKCPEVRITVVDKEEVISEWNSENFTSTEPDFEEILMKCRNRNLFFSTDYATCIKDADLIFISHTVTIKTKGRGINMTMDFGKVEEAAKMIATYSESDKIVVEKSSVSAKAVEKISAILKSHRQHGAQFHILSSPESIHKGSEMNELLNPRCVMIGCQKNPNSRAAAQALFELYERWVPRERIFILHNWSAEVSKVAENACLAQKISTLNALAIICEETGADFDEIAKMLLKDSQLNMANVKPSLGFGKYRKDVASLIFTCVSLKLPEAASYWDSVLNLNAFLMSRFAGKVKKILSPIENKDITILGFSSEKNSTDTTYSPAITVCEELLKEKCNLKIFDPAVKEEQIAKALDLDFVQSRKPKVRIFKEMYLSILGSSAIVICTDWDEFRKLNFSELSKWMKTPVVIDGHKFLNGSDLKEMGVEYYTIGSIPLTLVKADALENYKKNVPY